MKIAVIGGSGFIGTRLLGALRAAQYRVVNIDKVASGAHPDCTFVADIRDLPALLPLLRGCDGVVNLAAEHGDHVRPLSLYAEVNVAGARNLVTAADANAVQRLIYISSAAVYGHRQVLADEATPLLPDTEYGRSKAQAEAIYAAWAARFASRSLTLVRPCVVFGEGNRGNVHTLIDHIRRRRFVMVGRGDHRKSIAYVDNLVDFLMHQLSSPPGVTIRNYADQPDLSTEALVGQIRVLLGRSPSPFPRVPERLAIAMGWVLDSLAWIRGRPFAISGERIRKFCSDTRIATLYPRPESRITLTEGLARTVARVLAEAAPPG